MYIYIGSKRYARQTSLPSSISLVREEANILLNTDANCYFDAILKESQARTEEYAKRTEKKQPNRIIYLNTGSHQKKLEIIYGTTIGDFGHIAGFRSSFLAMNQI